MIRFNFSCGKLHWAGANLIQGLWSAAVIPSDHQVEDLLSITFSFGPFYRYTSVTLPKEQLKFASYDAALNFAEVTLDADSTTDPPHTPMVTVTFDAALPDVTDAYATLTIEEDTAIVAESLPADPERTGFTFTGWFAPEETKAFDFESIISSDVTLTAHWTEDAPPTPTTHPVRYAFTTNADVDLPQAVTDLLPTDDARYAVDALVTAATPTQTTYTGTTLTVKNGDMISEIPTDPEQAGHTFAGWFAPDAEQADRCAARQALFDTPGKTCYPTQWIARAT